MASVWTYHSYLTIPSEQNKRIAYTLHQPSNLAKAKLVFVCIPSLGDLKEEYRFLAPRLYEKGYKVVTMDHRGLGKSDVNFSSYGAHDCGSDVVALVKEILSEEEKAIIIGNSMGGAAAIWVGSELPDKVDGIVLLDAFIRDHQLPFGMATLLQILCNDFIGPSFWSSYYRSMYTLKSSPVKDLSEYVQGLKQNLNEKGRMYATKQQLFASKKLCTERIPDINKYHIPTLIIFGDKDPDFPSPNGPEDEAKWIRDAIKSEGTVNYHMINGAGHYPHVECSDQVSALIESFIQKHF